MHAMAANLPLQLANIARFGWFISSAIVLIFAPIRIWNVYRCNVKVIDSRNKQAKLLLWITYWIARLTTSARAPVPESKWTLPINLSAALLSCLLSWLEHSRTLRPSDILTFYLLAVIVSDVAAATELPTITDNPLLATIGCGAALLIGEGRSKTRFLKTEYQQHAPGTLAGTLGGALSPWVFSLVLEKRDERLAPMDLPRLEAECSSICLREKATHRWIMRAKPESSLTLFVLLLSCIRSQFLYAIPSRLALVLFRYAQPVLLETAINFANGRIEVDTKSAGAHSIIFGTAVVYIGMAMSSSLYQQSLNRMKVMVRGSLMSLIHEKALSKRGVDAQMENQKAIALISTEIEGLLDVGEMVNEGWAQLVEVLVGMTLLSYRIGWVCPFLLLSIFANLLIGCSQMSRYVAKHLRQRQRAWNEATQTRLTATAEFINQMKSVKMAGMSSSIHATMSRLRRGEIETSKKLRWILVLYNASANALGIFSPVAVLMVFALLAQRNGATLDAKTAFTSTALLTLVTHPANMIMTIIPRAVAAKVGFERIQAFLLEPNLPDSRTKSHGGVTKQHLGNDIAVRLQNATVRLIPTQPPIFEQINLTVKRGCTTVCLGFTGSGKTALVRTVLGDIALSSGTLEVQTPRIAVCMQRPWLPNGSIREAICGMSDSYDYDAEWYTSVVRACCLEMDLEVLPGSDATQVGYCGMNLSGGQRQRVALARAVYSHCNAIILDDPFSSLDRVTEDQILHNLLGANGLLRRHDITCFITTNTTRHLAFADCAAIIENSNIRMLDVRKQSRDEAILRPENDYGREIPLSYDSPLQADNKIFDRFHAVADSVLDVERKPGDWDTYRYYFRAAGLANCWLLAACTAAYSFFITIPQYWLRLWTESHNASTNYYACIYVLLAILAWTATNGTMWTTHMRVATTSGASFHSSLLTTTLGATSSFIFQTDGAVTINRFGQDMRSVDRDLPPALGNLGNQIFKMTMQIGLLLSVQPRLFLLLPIGAIVVYLVQKVYLSISRQVRLMDLEQRAGIYSSLIETIDGLETIRAFGWEEQCARQYSLHLDDSQRPYYLLMCLQRWLNIVMDLIVSAIAIVVVSALVMFRDSASGAQIGLAFNIILMMNTTLLRLVESWTNLEVNLGAVSRLKQFQAETPQESLALEGSEPNSGWPHAGDIAMEDLRVAYNSEAVVLEHCTLRIKAGQKVIIRGRTGSGKSTILLSLLKLLELSNGSVKVDGVDLASVSRRSIREACFITLPQDPIILPSFSLRQHIDPRTLYSNDQIIKVLHAAKLWLHMNATSTEKTTSGRPVDKLLNHEILDQPLNRLPSLSSGQMQLLSLARAALHSECPSRTSSDDWHKPILLVDEATSSLDTETEELALEMIDRFFICKGLTVIMVTHKLDAVMKTLRRGVDCVVSMEEGKIRAIDIAE